VNDRRLHFGLGREQTVNLEIRWPSGTKDVLANVKPDRIITVKEGLGIISSLARIPP
jgi:hypothetical protein